MRRVVPSCFALATVALAASGLASAMDVVKHAASYADKKFQFELTAILDAPPERVGAVLKDYDRYPTLDPRILDARVLERPKECVAILATTLRACFGPFCRSVKRVENVTESPLGLVAISDPDRSDVRFGETRVEWAPHEGRTQVTYHTSITPDFWIPPLIGRRLMLSTLEEATTSMFRQVEIEAQAPH